MQVPVENPVGARARGIGIVKNYWSLYSLKLMKSLICIYD
jgi:hypothetical protein